MKNIHVVVTNLQAHSLGVDYKYNYIRRKHVPWDLIKTLRGDSFCSDEVQYHPGMCLYNWCYLTQKTAKQTMEVGI